MTKYEELAIKLTALIKQHCKWDEDFTSYGRCTLDMKQELAMTVLEYRDSGVGAHYTQEALQVRYPDRKIDLEEEGGCDTCGHGQTVTIIIMPPVDLETL